MIMRGEKSAFEKAPSSPRAPILPLNFYTLTLGARLSVFLFIGGNC